ncbi:hypothetical protein HK102_010377, partial [Quaeritorhiza haematococci]
SEKLSRRCDARRGAVGPQLLDAAKSPTGSHGEHAGSIRRRHVDRGVPEIQDLGGIQAEGFGELERSGRVGLARRPLAMSQYDGERPVGEIVRHASPREEIRDPRIEPSRDVPAVSVEATERRDAGRHGDSVERRVWRERPLKEHGHSVADEPPIGLDRMGRETALLERLIGRTPDIFQRVQEGPVEVEEDCAKAHDRTRPA